MDFLRMLAEIRTPFFDSVLGGITLLGEEIAVTAVLIVVLWNISKRAGYYLFYVSMFSICCNNTLKQIFRIPRPWVLDPDFQIVESARAAATGYSFPSGHTASAIGLFGGCAMWVRKGWQKAVLIAAFLLVAFSRLYLGVHTPLDVGVSLALGLVIVPVLYIWYQRMDKVKAVELLLDIVMLALVVGGLLYITVPPMPADATVELQANAAKNAWTLLGMSAGLVVSRRVEARWIHFDVKAVWWIQVLKTAVGLGLIVGVRALLKQPLTALCGGQPFAHAIRYFIIAVLGGAVYPMTFKWWYKLDRRRKAA